MSLNRIASVATEVVVATLSAGAAALYILDSSGNLPAVPEPVTIAVQPEHHTVSELIVTTIPLNGMTP